MDKSYLEMQTAISYNKVLCNMVLEDLPLHFMTSHEGVVQSSLVFLV